MLTCITERFDVCVLRCPWCSQPSRQATRARRPASQQPAPSLESSPIWTPPSCSPRPGRSIQRTTNPSLTTGWSWERVWLCLYTLTFSFSRRGKVCKYKSDWSLRLAPLVIFHLELTEWHISCWTGGRKPLKLETTNYPQGLKDGGSVTSLPVPALWLKTPLEARKKKKRRQRI